MINSLPIRTINDRIVPAVKKTGPKINLQTKSKQKSPLTFDGYNPYLVEKEDDTSPIGTKLETGKIKISHASGPLINTQHEIKSSFLNPDIQYDEEIIHNWRPHMGLTVFDGEEQKPLTALEAATKKQVNQDWIPHWFVNPMQDLDYLVIEAMLRQTFAGPLNQALTKFLMGRGFRPELELINPNEDEEKNEKEINENQEIITDLIQIDNQLNFDDSDYLDTSFTEKIAALISTTNGFNRSALMFGYDKPITVNEKTYKQIPSSMKFAHARDLGIIEVDPGTHRLKSVQWRNAYYMIPARDMIYLWNPLISATTRNSWLYGDSMIMPMLDASRVIRKNIGVNFPAMAEATWAGMFVLAVKPQGQTLADKQAEYQQIASNMVRGGPNILMEDPEELSFNTIDFQPKVTEFKDLTEALIKYCVATYGLPHSMFYDEDSSNRATMIGKIQLAISTTINPMREWIGREIAKQWYQRWFRLLYKDSEKAELLKKFRIKMAFEDLHIEEWFDKVEAVNELDSRKQLTDEAYGELTGIQNYKNKVEKDAETNPGGSGGKGLDLGEGKQLKIKENKRKEQLKAKAKKKA